MIKKILIFSFCIFFLFAKEKSYITIGAGVHDVLRDNRRCFEFLMEYKSSSSVCKIHPFWGGMITQKKSFYGYFGFSLDLVLKKKIILFPSLAMGAYFKGDGKDLGFPLEFRSSIRLGWQFKNLSRIGAGIYHISNASLGSRNPGEESVILFYSIPI